MNSHAIELALSQQISAEVRPELPLHLAGLSVEVNSWAVTIHAYQEVQIEDETYELIEKKTQCLLKGLPLRAGEPWQLTVCLHRLEPNQPPNYRGTPVQ